MFEHADRKTRQPSRLRHKSPESPAAREPALQRAAADRLAPHAAALNAQSSAPKPGLQGPAAQRLSDHAAALAARPFTAHPMQRAKATDRGNLPQALKSGVEALSGAAMDGVRVHYNSTQPAQLRALAYAQGNDIHIAPGQERHLPHEAWHVAQQRSGRVQPTAQMQRGVPLNDDPGLETEADTMGARASAQGSAAGETAQIATSVATDVVQRLIDPDTGEGDQIKVYDEDSKTIQTVYFAGTRRDEVLYRIEKAAKPKKGKGGGGDAPLSIHKKWAFPVSYKTSQIEGEVAMSAEADEAISDDSLGISRDVLTAILARVTTYVAEKDEELEVQLNLARIVAVLQGDTNLRDFFKGAEVADLPDLLDEEYALPEIVAGLANTGTASASSAAQGGGGDGGSSKPEWKTNKTKAAKGALLEKIAEGEDRNHEVALKIAVRSTLHHKISRSRLGRLYALYDQTPGGTPGLSDMTRFLTRISEVTGTGDKEKALDNWLANIELGPKVEDRAEGDDPGEDFDGSYPGGQATPRTERLQEAELIINGAAKGTDVPWARVADYLLQTQIAHERLVHGNAFTHPHLRQWRPTDKGYVRDKQAARGGDHQD